jgi:hypothetical protein
MTYKYEVYASIIKKALERATQRRVGKSIKIILENALRMRSKVSQLEATIIILDAKTVGK